MLLIRIKFWTLFAVRWGQQPNNGAPVDYCEVQWRWLWSRRVDPTSPEPPYVGAFEAEELWPEQAKAMKANQKNWMTESDWERAMATLDKLQDCGDGYAGNLDPIEIDSNYRQPRRRERHWKGNLEEEQKHIEMLVQQAEESYQRVQKEKELEKQQQDGGEGEAEASNDNDTLHGTEQNAGEEQSWNNDSADQEYGLSEEGSSKVSQTPLPTPPITPATTGMMRGMAQKFLKDRRARDGWQSSKPIPYDPRVDRQTGIVANLFV